MKYFYPLLPFLAGWGLLCWPVITLATIGFSERLTLQLVLFAFVVCLPTWRTGRMSYVDIGWPWGLDAYRCD